jgi:DNA polymerase III subunit epsilon
VGRVTDTLAMAKEMYPGKRNSLDALCDRLGVDNSGRTLHGALLDAELLADVYINLTRGQDALLIDMAAADTFGGIVTRVDLTAFTLPVLLASDQEAAAHEEVLKQLDKASGGKTVWRIRPAASEPPSTGSVLTAGPQSWAAPIQPMA